MLPLSDSHPAGIYPFWVILIILVNIVVFFLEISAPDTDLFIAQYALIPSLVNLSDFSTLTPFITSQFLHGGFLHLASNMLFLWVFGDNVEGKTGFLFFPILYLGSGIVGALSQYLLMPDSTIPMLGASGAVAGVLGAYFAWFPHHKIKTLVFILFFITIIEIPASFMLFYWFITQLFSGAFSVSEAADIGGVAYMAHVGGFATGWFLAKLLSPNKTLEEI